MDNIQKCTMIRIIWTAVIGSITASGLILISDFKEYYIGISLILIGAGLFVYEINTWKQGTKHDRR